jgi:hypothetical protein
LAPHDHHPIALTPGLWKHESHDIIDNFVVYYTAKAGADHLLATLEQHYQVSTDRGGTRYCGLTLAWDYNKRTCDISMPGYIARVLQRFQHVASGKAEHSPHSWQRPTFGAKTQFAPVPDSAAALNLLPTNFASLKSLAGSNFMHEQSIPHSLPPLANWPPNNPSAPRPQWKN